MNTPNPPSQTQQEFEQMAYAYGIQPAVCALLGEFVYEKIRESWQNGRCDGWARAYQLFAPNLHP